MGGDPHQEDVPLCDGVSQGSAIGQLGGKIRLVDVCNQFLKLKRHFLRLGQELMAYSAELNPSVPWHLPPS